LNLIRVMPAKGQDVSPSNFLAKLNGPAQRVAARALGCSRQKRQEREQLQ
jgi:hypothetical protein